MPPKSCPQSPKICSEYLKKRSDALFELKMLQVSNDRNLEVAYKFLKNAEIIAPAQEVIEALKAKQSQARIEMSHLGVEVQRLTKDREWREYFTERAKSEMKLAVRSQKSDGDAFKTRLNLSRAFQKLADQKPSQIADQEKSALFKRQRTEQRAQEIEQTLTDHEHALAQKLRENAGLDAWGNMSPSNRDLKYSEDLFELNVLKMKDWLKSIYLLDSEFSQEVIPIEAKISALNSKREDPPANIVIAFEGTGVWEPGIFRFQHLAHHSTSAEEMEGERVLIRDQSLKLGMGNSGLLYGAIYHVFEGGAAYSSDERWRGEKFGREISEQHFEKFTDILYLSMSPVAKYNQSMAHDELALACLKKTYHPYTDKLGELKWPTLSVIGFSSGVARGLEFARILEVAQPETFSNSQKVKPQIDLFVGIDPVESPEWAIPKALGSGSWPPKVNFKSNNENFRLPNNVKQSLGFYQDRGTGGVDTNMTGSSGKALTSSQSSAVLVLRGSALLPPKAPILTTSHYRSILVDIKGENRKKDGHYYINLEPTVLIEISKVFGTIYQIKDDE